jgi:hypothetical protein
MDMCGIAGEKHAANRVPAGEPRIHRIDRGPSHRVNHEIEARSARQQQGAPLAGMAGGVASHIHVQSGVGAAIDFMPAFRVIGDAPLSGRHDADQVPR